MASEDRPDLSGLRFLVVEDQGFQRWAIGHMLEELGAKEVLSAPDGHIAIEIFREPERPIDVIVTDLNMPEMDGMAFIRHVGESGLPAAIILASDLDRALIASVETMTAAYGLRLLGAIQKPVTARKLVALLRGHTKVAPPGPARIRQFALAEIEAAIAADQFEPYFQAKVALAGGELRGAEAMVRWRHPVHGLVGPASFIDALESRGRIDALTFATLGKAFAACRDWRAAGIGASVSVNLSLTLLADTTLADRLAARVAEERLAAHDVVVEITETAAASHLGKVLENLSRLRMKGFGLSIDDYGTGFATMEQLTRVAFTELKIDQSFVRAAPAHASSRAVLESSLEMAAKLDIVAVAEGVETREQLALLRDLRCPVVQGYYIAHPMPAGDFLAWAKKATVREAGLRGA